MYLSLVHLLRPLRLQRLLASADTSRRLWLSLVSDALYTQVEHERVVNRLVRLWTPAILLLLSGLSVARVIGVRVCCRVGLCLVVRYG